MCCINNKDVLLDIHSFVSHIILSMNYMPVTECHTMLGTMMKKTQPHPQGRLQIGKKRCTDNNWTWKYMASHAFICDLVWS